MCTRVATPDEEHRRLSGRVGAAHDRDLLALAELALEVGGAVVDAGALEARERRNIELPVLRAGGDDDGARAHHLAVGEIEAVGPAVAVEADDGPADGDLGAELLRLA